MLKRVWNKHQREIIVAAVCLVVSFLLYAFSLQGEFVRDDVLVTSREDLRTADSFISVWFQPYAPGDQAPGVYRPLNLLSFAINFVVFGEATWHQHAVNVLLNAANVFLVYLIVRKLFAKEYLALVAAAIFGFMPIHTEAVAFIKSRDELMASFFCLLAWVLFLKATAAKSLDKRAMWLSGWCFVLGVLSKETLFSVPGIFFASWWILSKPKASDFLTAARIYAVTAGSYMLLRFLILGKYAFGSDNALYYINPLIDASFAERIVTGSKIAFLMISKTFYPWKLSATYNFNQIPVINSFSQSWEAVVGAVMLILLAWIAVWRKFDVRLRVGAATTLIAYLMVSKLIFSGGEITGERWMYFPSIGLAIMLAVGFEAIYRRREQVGLAVLATVLAFYGYSTVNRNLAWINLKSLGESMLKAAPNSVISHGALADWNYRNYNLAEARQYAENSISIYPNFAPGHELLGLLAYGDGEFVAAANKFAEVYRIDEKLVSPGTRKVYGRTLLKLGRYSQAIEVANGSLSLAYTPEAQMIKAAGLYKTKGLAEAKKYFDWSKSPDDIKLQQIERLLK